MKQRVRDLTEQGSRLFSKRQPLTTLWQTFAENFYPFRADFTTSRSLGEEFASNLMTGRPLLAQRDLGNALSSMLRPRGQAWFKARTGDEGVNNDASARQWLDAKSDILRRIMYDQRSRFIRATKEGDNDFITFGQTVLQVTPNQYLDGVLYRNWHLRDVVWCENAEQTIDTIHRDWKLEARQLAKLFPNAPGVERIRKIAEKEPYREIKCRHIILPEDEYDVSTEKKGRSNRLPFTSVYIDTENDIILEEVPSKRTNYIIPRWVTVSGSQYAYSPAVVVALPDARMLQQMALTMMEAGQKAVDPPMKATQEAIVGGVNMYAGSITWVDAEYDERMGPAIEPLLGTRPDLNWGDTREEKIEKLISEAFFLNVINLPETMGGDKMTAYETQQRVEEYIRRALPLFEPMETEYNGGLCEQTWNLAMDLGAFGSMEDMPEILQGREINWQFESPLQAANDRVKSQAFSQSCQLLAEAAQIDPNVRYDFNIDKAFREALGGVAPASWVVPEDQAAQAKQVAQQQQQAMQTAQTLASGSDVATKMAGAVEGAGKAAQAVQAARAGQQAAA